MGSTESHIRQWKHNRAFLSAIPPEYPDWLVTVCFYVALHAVDALLAHDRVERVTSHDSRNGVPMHTNRYKAIWSSYFPLFDLSRTVRYMADPAKWVPPPKVEKDVIARYLYPIEKSVQNLIGQNLGLPKVVLAKTVPAGPTPAAAAPEGE